MHPGSSTGVPMPGNGMAYSLYAAQSLSIATYPMKNTILE